MKLNVLFLELKGPCSTQPPCNTLATRTRTTKSGRPASRLVPLKVPQRVVEVGLVHRKHFESRPPVPSSISTRRHSSGAELPRFLISFIILMASTRWGSTSLSGRWLSRFRRCGEDQSLFNIRLFFSPCTNPNLLTVPFL